MGGKFSVPLGNSDLSFAQKQFIVDSNYSFAMCDDDTNQSAIFDLNEIVTWHINNPNQQGEIIYPGVPEDILKSSPIAKYLDASCGNVSCNSTSAEVIWQQHPELSIIKLKESQDFISSDTDLENFESIYLARITNLKTQEELDAYKTDMMNLFEIVEPTQAEIAASRELAIKSQSIRKFQDILRAYFSDIFTGDAEKEVLYYLQDFKLASNGNMFDATIGRLLSFDVGYSPEELLFTRQEFNETFTSIFNSIIYSVMILHDITHINKYRNQYGMLNSINLVNTKGEMEMTVSSNPSLQFMIEGNVLTIYHESLLPLEFSKINYVYKNDSNASSEDIVKNYLNMFLSFKDFEVKSKLSIFLIIMSVVAVCMSSFVLMENIVLHGRMPMSEFDKIGNLIDNLMDGANNAALHNGGYNVKVVNGICTSTCPVTFRVYGAEDSEGRLDANDPSYEQWLANPEIRFLPLYVPNDVSIEEEYFMELGNVEYTITHAMYEENDETGKRKLTEIKLQAVGLNDNSCRAKSVNMPSIDVNEQKEMRMNLRSRNITDIKSEYTNTGNGLKKLNMELEKYKTQINRLSRKNVTQITVIKNIDIRSYIYYAIFAMIVIIGIGIFIFDAKQDIKVYVMLAILTVIVVMNVVNYFLNYDTIESFMASKKRKEHFENMEDSDYIIRYDFNKSLANTNGSHYNLKNIGNVVFVLETSENPSHLLFNGSSYLEIRNQNCDLSVFSTKNFAIEFSVYIPSDTLSSGESCTIIDAYSKDANNNHRGWYVDLSQNSLEVNIAMNETLTPNEGIDGAAETSNKVQKTTFLFAKYDQWVTVRIDINDLNNLTGNVTCVYSTQDDANVTAENISDFVPPIYTDKTSSTEFSIGTPTTMRIGNRNQDHIGDKDYIIRNNVKMNYMRYITPRENISNQTCADIEETPEIIEAEIQRLNEDQKKTVIGVVNNTIAEYLTDALTKFMIALLSSQSNDLYKTITGSLKNEIMSFKDHEKAYKYKIESDEKSLDIMKHEMIQKTGLINFLSVSFLIVAIIVLIYVYIDSDNYNNILIGIVVVLLVINSYQYWYTVLHPTRTNARNKYWYSLSGQNQKIMS